MRPFLKGTFLSLCMAFFWVTMVSHAQEGPVETISQFKENIFSVARDLYQSGRYRATLEELSELEKKISAIKNQSELGLIYYWKGICFNRVQEFDQAIFYFKKAIENGNSPIDIHYELGQALFASEKYRAARIQFQKSYKKKFKPGVSLYYMAFISKEMGENKKAYTFFKSIDDLKDKESIEVRQASQLQIADIYLEESMKKAEPLSFIESVVIPQYEKAYELDQDSSLAPVIKEKILGLQKKYDLVMFQLINGRPTLNPRYLLRFSEEVGMDSNVTFSPNETTISKSKQKSLYSRSDFLGRYTFYFRDYFSLTPEFRFNFTHYFNRVPEIYRNDNMLVAPALRTAYEHQLWGKPSSFLFDYEYSEAKRDVNAKKRLEFNSRSHSLMMGERFNFFSSGESVVRLRHRQLESYLSGSDSKLLSLIFEHIGQLGKNTALLYLSYDRMRVKNDLYDTNSLTLRGDLIFPRWRDWFTPSLGLSLTSTDPINARSSRGQELLLNPSARFAKTFRKNWRANLKFDYQKNNSRDQENFAFKKSIYAVEIEYIF